MESVEPNSHLTNQHSHTHSLSDPSVDTDVNLVHVLALELETLVLDYVKNEEFGQDLKRGSFNDEIKSGSLIESGNRCDLDAGLENFDGDREVLEEGVEKISVFDDQDSESGNVSGKRGDFDGDKKVREEGFEKVGGFEDQESESWNDFDGRKNIREEGVEKVGGFDYRENESWNDFDGGKNVLEDGVEVMDGGYGDDNGESEGVDGGGYGEDDGWGGGLGSGDNDNGGMKSYHYQLRPDAEDCLYYVRTGMCKFGSSCKFNHPLKKRNQQPFKDTRKQKDENFERNKQQIDCKYFLSSAGCKYGKACKYNHTRGKSVLTPVLEYNFLGLPIRPGEKECPYYMRTGSCKYGPSCRFNHPDPTAVGGADGPTSYGNDAPLPLQTAPKLNMPSWAAPRTPDPAASSVPMMYSPPQNMPPPNTDWNGYPAPAPVPALPHVYPSSERGLPIPPAFFLNNPPTGINLYTHHQQAMPVSEYPERPGQLDCSFYMKTGDCKYKASCKFNHPRNRITKNSPSLLSNKGLPLRPDQIICTHYSRYGICKYGPACKYDHPINYSNSSPAGQGYRPGGSDRPLIQQSV